jgi:hypothetical protein
VFAFHGEQEAGVSKRYLIDGPYDNCWGSFVLLDWFLDPKVSVVDELAGL